MRIALIAYLVVILIVAFRFRQTSKSYSGYTLANRSLGKFLSTFGLLGSFIGGGTLLAVVGHVSNTGLGDLWYLLSASFSFVVLAWIAPELRDSEVQTLPQFVGAKFGIWAKRAVIPFAILAICGFLGVQIGAASFIVGRITGWGELNVIIGMVAFVTAYTWMGGMKADTVTDGIQFGIVFIGLMLCAYWLYSQLEEIELLESTLYSLNDSRFMSLTGAGLVRTLGVALVLPLIVVTSPTYHQRVYSTDSRSTARMSGFWSASIYIAVAAIILFIGIGGRIVLEGIDSYDNILPAIIDHGIGGWAGGIVLAALIAAVMSSVDTHLIALSTIVCSDVFSVGQQKGDHATGSLQARIVVLLGACSGVLLVVFAGSLFSLLAGTWAILVGTTAGPVILGAKAPWIRKEGILAGIILGGLVSTVALLAGVQAEYLAIPCAALSFGVPGVVHLFSIRKVRSFFQKLFHLT